MPEEHRQLTDAEIKIIPAIQAGSTTLDGVYPTALDAIASFVQEMKPLWYLDESDKRSVANGIKILRAYFKHYADDPLEVLRDESGMPYIERECEAKLYEDEKIIIILHGTIDLILRNRLNKHIYVGDHKTTASLGKDFYNRINPNHQYSGYLWLAKEVLGLDVQAFMVNGIQVAKTKAEFARQFTDRSELDFQEMTEAYVEAAYRILWAIDRKSFPMTAPNPCAAYGGCQYLEICSAPQKLRENILEGKYGKI